MHLPSSRKRVVLVNVTTFSADKASFVFENKCMCLCFFFRSGDVRAGNEVTRDSSEDACLKILMPEAASE